MKNDIFEKNREAWNEALLYHQKARNNSLQQGFKDNNFTTLNRECDIVLIKNLKKIDLKDKIIAQLPCNNGRELLSLMKFGAKKGIGFDISDLAISEAKELAKISNLNIEFYRINILDIDDTYNYLIDFIYISEGSLQWFTSLDDFLSYFERKPYSYKNGLDYVGQIKYEAKECCWYFHKISDIINAIINNGLEIENIEEYNMEMANNEKINNLEKFPLSYIINCKKK